MWRLGLQDRMSSQVILSQNIPYLLWNTSFIVVNSQSAHWHRYATIFFSNFFSLFAFHFLCIFTAFITVRCLFPSVPMSSVNQILSLSTVWSEVLVKL